MKSPVFIFSLPRSGSTLLQRVLAGHSDIATSGEPWVMLPFLYATKEKGVLAEYSHCISQRAVSEFVIEMGDKKYCEYLNDFVSSLYREHCKLGEKYFLDKTPRYYLIINEIKKVFPEAKFIFLFRNPLHVIGSIIETFSSGELSYLYRYNVDIVEGMKSLSLGYESLKDVAYALNYEKLIVNPEFYIKEICSYLDIEYQSAMLNDLAGRKVVGSLGDPVIENIHKGVDTTGVEKWKLNCSGLYRKKVIRKYIDKIDEKYIFYQGYSKKVILDDVDSLGEEVGTYLKDFYQYNGGRLVRSLKLNLFVSPSYRHWLSNKYIG